MARSDYVANLALTANAGGVATGLNRAVSHWTRFGRVLNAQASGINNSFVRLGATIAGVIAGANVIGIWRDFGQAMSTVQAITGATGDEFTQLEATARNLGRTTRFSSTQAAEGMQFLARAGFDTNQVLGAIGGTLQLAQAGALGLGRAADIASNVLQGMRLEVDQTARVVDVLTLQANRSNTSVEQLGDAFKFVAPVASGMNVSLEETSAALGALSDAGLQASIAGTGLRRVMAELENPAAKMEKALEALGLTASDIRVSQVGLANAIDVLANAGIGAGEALELFGQRGGPAFEVLSSSVPKIREMTLALQDAEGTAAQIATVMDDNLNGAILRLNSAWESFVLTLGRVGGTDILIAIVDFMADALRAMDRLILQLAINVREAWFNILGLIIDAINGLSPALRVLGLDVDGVTASLSSHRTAVERSWQEMIAFQQATEGTVEATQTLTLDTSLLAKAFAEGAKEEAEVNKTLRELTKLQEAVQPILTRTTSNLAKLREEENILNDALREGIITQIEYDKALKEIRDEINELTLDTQTFGEQVSHVFRKAREDSDKEWNTFGVTIANVLLETKDEIGALFTDGLLAGQSFADTFRDIWTKLTRDLIATWTQSGIDRIFSAATGGGGSLLGGIAQVASGGLVSYFLGRSERRRAERQAEQAEQQAQIDNVIGQLASGASSIISAAISNFEGDRPASTSVQDTLSAVQTQVQNGQVVEHIAGTLADSLAAVTPEVIDTAIENSAQTFVRSAVDGIVSAEIADGVYRSLQETLGDDFVFGELGTQTNPLYAEVTNLDTITTALAEGADGEGVPEGIDLTNLSREGLLELKASLEKQKEFLDKIGVVPSMIVQAISFIGQKLIDNTIGDVDEALIVDAYTEFQNAFSAVTDTAETALTDTANVYALVEGSITKTALAIEDNVVVVSNSAKAYAVAEEAIKKVAIDVGDSGGLLASAMADAALAVAEAGGSIDAAAAAARAVAEAARRTADDSGRGEGNDGTPDPGERDTHHFRHGGIVPGVRHEPVLIMAHGGEEVIPVGEVGSAHGMMLTIVQNVTGDVNAATLRALRDNAADVAAIIDRELQVAS